MREIKVKVWDKANKQMSVGMDLFTLSGYLAAIYPKLGNELFLEYTGLKDRNGKEIYEGDIVQFSSFENGRELHTVDFWFGVFGITGVADTLRIGRNFQSCGNDLVNLFEVIGNIYENPELIK